MYYDQVNDIYLVSKMGQILKVILKGELLPSLGVRRLASIVR
jgi:hypothetical protein